MILLHTLSSFSFLLLLLAHSKKVNMSLCNHELSIVVVVDVVSVILVSGLLSYTVFKTEISNL